MSLARWGVADTGKFAVYAEVLEREANAAFERGDRAECGRLLEQAAEVRETPLRCSIEKEYRSLVVNGAKRLVQLAEGSQEETGRGDERALSCLYGARTEGASLDQAFNTHVWLRMAVESAAGIMRPAPGRADYWIRREILARLVDEEIRREGWRELVMKPVVNDPVKRSVYKTGPSPWHSVHK